MKSFASDNYAGVLPEVMEALNNVNVEHARSYGADAYTQEAKQLFATAFDMPCEVFFVFNGTGANVLSISGATQSYNAVLCANTSHIYCDESSAPETFTGCRFFALTANNEGKLTPEIVAERLIRKGDIHYAQTAILSITQTTEYGTLYTPAEIKALSDVAHEHGLYFHMDGARFFNAAAALNVDLADISSKAGVDILSLGGTKAGMMYGEAVVVFNKGLLQHLPFKHKQTMQLASKNRFIAAQFHAMLHQRTWRQYAQHANSMAQYLWQVLQQFPEIKFTKPVHANALFAEIPKDWYEPLQAVSPFYIWNELTYEVRLMCSWDTTKEDIEQFSNAIKAMKEKMSA